MNASRFKTMGWSVALVALELVGCGGGGGSSSEVPNYQPPVPQVERGPVTSVPAASYDDALRAAAFNRINKHRADAGIGLYRQNAALDLAAQKHSKYQVVNSVVSHDEIPGMPEYFLQTSWGRMSIAGYPTEQEGTYEVASGENSLTAPPTELIAEKLIDGLMSAPYHRAALIEPSYADVGVGIYWQGPMIRITADIARTKANAQGSPNNQLILWPPNGSTGIPTQLDGEEQDDKGNVTVAAGSGYAASVHVNRQYRGIGDVSRFEITDAVGNVVKTRLITHGDFVAALPLAPLAKNTTYNVVFEGLTRDVDSGKKSPAQRTWVFTTGDKIKY
jgi:uncharacterized protein YkwD